VYDSDGYLEITGRLKDMFIVGESNAYPAEVERILLSHPQVKQAVVVGMLGEVGMAFVQLHESAWIDEVELQAFCRARMADYKVPRNVDFVTAFPRTSTRKIPRFVLNREAQQTATANQMAV
jgi:fatty-acyl-CoA synthase